MIKLFFIPGFFAINNSNKVNVINDLKSFKSGLGVQCRHKYISVQKRSDDIFGDYLVLHCLKSCTSHSICFNFRNSLSLAVMYHHQLLILLPEGLMSQLNLVPEPAIQSYLSALQNSS
jgi:hypothetical protein